MADEQLRRITLENGRVIYIGEAWLTDMQVFEGRIAIDLGNGVTHYVTGTDIDAFYASTFTVSPTSVTITNNPLNIGGTVAVSSVGGTVSTNTTITNNPLDVRELPIAITPNQTVVSLNGTSQTILSANAARKYLLVRNTSNADATVYVRFNAGAATTTNSMPLKKGESYEFPPAFTYTGAVTAISSAYGADFVTVVEGT